MLVNLSWLDDFVEHRLDRAELARRLTLAGLEVESATPVNPCHERVVVGLVDEVVPHPDNSRLKVCSVDVAKEHNLQIVCGAPNVTGNRKYPVALIDSEINGLTVKAKYLASVSSNGVLCSESELGVGDVSDRLMELDSTAKVGTAINEHLNLNDSVLDFELTPNRADCLSVEGVAREVAILSSQAFITPSIPSVPASIEQTIPIQVDAPSDCPVYCGRLIRNIRSDSVTPDWMKERLRRVGLRPIHPIVDVTNYVMMQLGQPMHAFDVDIFNSSKIVVRHAAHGEQLKLLDESMLDLHAGSLLIADPDKPIGLAGVMGGESSGIHSNTNHVFLEAAFFSQSAIRNSVARYKLHTDASHRFERGVDPNRQARAIERATQLILEIAQGQPGPLQEVRHSDFVPRKKACKVREKRIERVLGLKISQDKIQQILESVNESVEKADDGWNVTPPSYRFDLEEEYDQIEEVSRIYGYDKVPSTLSFNYDSRSRVSESAVREASIKSELHSLGYHEVITYSFVDPELQECLKPNSYAKPLANPLAVNMSVMRNSLFPGLIDAFLENYRRSKNRIRIYEIGKVFTADSEFKKLGGLLFGSHAPLQWGVQERQVDFFDLKGDVMRVLNLTRKTNQVRFAAQEHEGLHPFCSATIFLEGSPMGVIGQIHPNALDSFKISEPVYVFELDMDRLQERDLFHYSAISIFPSIVRDLSILVPVDQQIADISDNIRASAGKYLRRLQLFDVYFVNNIKGNTKSITYRLTYQSDEKTLTDSEIDVSVEQILRKLASRFGAKLRD